MKTFIGIRRAVLGAVLALAASFGAASASAQECGTDKTIQIAELTWSSAATLANIHAKILEDGYGCNVELIAADALATNSTFFSRGEPAIIPELWTGTIQDEWTAATESGAVASAGSAFADGLVQGWWIPTFVAEANPGLTSVADLPEYAELFADPDDPSKGRLVSCPPGWVCEVVDGNLATAFGLNDTFNVFHPGSEAALNASIESAFLKEEPIVFYYWTPTLLVGQHDMTLLDMPTFDASAWDCVSQPDCDTPMPTDYPTPEVLKAVAGWVAEEAPAISDYLEAAQISSAQASALMAWEADNSASGEETAEHFLMTEEETWTSWVPAEVAENVKASLL